MLQLQREMASQVIVVLFSDLDRMWKPEEPHAVPAMYFFRGYSLSMETMRKLIDDCKAECKMQDVIVSSADGEFYPIIVRDKNGRPFTKFQLSKDLWNEVSKLKNNELLTNLEAVFQNFTMKKVYSQNNSLKICKSYYIESAYKTLVNFRTPSKGWNVPENKKKPVNKTTENEPRQNGEVSEEMHDTSMFATSYDTIIDVDDSHKLTDLDPDETISYDVEAYQTDVGIGGQDRYKIREDEVASVSLLLKELNSKT